VEELKRSVGRPRTTVDDLKKDWQQIIMDCGQEGGSAVEMRCLLALGESAWGTLLEDSDEFRRTVETAKDMCEVWWERTGRAMVTGAPGNATVWGLNMKNRFGWFDKQGVDLTTNGKDLTPTFAGMYGKPDPDA